MPGHYGGGKMPAKKKTMKKAGKGGSPYQAPPTPHPGPFVPAPGKKDDKLAQNIFHPESTKPGNSPNDNT